MITSTLFKKILKSLTIGVLGLSVLSAQALTISPARAELTGDPGETVQDSFIIINDQDSDQTYYTSVEAFESQGESGTPNFTSTKEGLPSWVNVAQTITIKKGERMKVPYTVAIPTGADAGGHFAAIFLSTVPPSAGEGQVSVGAKVGMLILLKVTGNVKEAGGLSSFALKEGGKTIPHIPLTFVYKFKNDGNDRVMPEGAVTITNMFGGKVATLDANPAKGNVLPGVSPRRFEVKYGQEEAPTTAAPFKEQLAYQWKHFAVGMYTATLLLTFGNSGKAESSLTYFMFPWQLLSVMGGVFLITILVLLFIVKRYNQWIIKQARAAQAK